LLSRPFQVAIHSFYYDDPFSSVSNLSFSLQEILLILLQSHTFSTCFSIHTFSICSVLMLFLTSQLSSLLCISYILLTFLTFPFSHCISPLSILKLSPYFFNPFSQIFFKMKNDGFKMATFCKCQNQNLQNSLSSASRHWLYQQKRYSPLFLSSLTIILTLTAYIFVK